MANIMDPVLPIEKILGHYFGLFWRSRYIAGITMSYWNHVPVNRYGPVNSGDQAYVTSIEYD